MIDTSQSFWHLYGNQELNQRSAELMAFNLYMQCKAYNICQAQSGVRP